MTADSTPYLWGYCCARRSEQVFSAEEQARLIEETAKKLPGTWVGCRVEDASQADLCWRARPVLKELLGEMREGDCFIALRPDRIDPTPRRFAEALAFLARRGIHTHFTDFGGSTLDLDPKIGQVLATILAKFVATFHEFQRETGREVCRKRKELGLAVGGYPTYGRRRVRKRYGKVDEWCPAQCAILRELKKRRDSGESWGSIAEDFCRRRLKTGANQPWARRRQWRGQVQYTYGKLRRAYKWYTDLLLRGEDLGA